MLRWSGIVRSDRCLILMMRSSVHVGRIVTMGILRYLTLQMMWNVCRQGFSSASCIVICDSMLCCVDITFLPVVDLMMLFDLVYHKLLVGFRCSMIIFVLGT